MNEIALKFLTSANRPELWAVFSGWVTELPADRVESGDAASVSNTGSCHASSNVAVF